MSDLDRLTIHEVIALHGHLVDSGELDRLGEVFTADVVYDLTPMGGQILVGTSALVQAALDLGDQNPVGRHVTNIVVTSLGDVSAKAVSKAIGIRADGSSGSLVYEDDLVRVADGWRIGRRSIRLRSRPLTR